MGVQSHLLAIWVLVDIVVGRAYDFGVYRRGEAGFGLDDDVRHRLEGTQHISSELGMNRDARRTATARGVPLETDPTVRLVIEVAQKRMIGTSRLFSKHDVPTWRGASIGT